MYIKNVLIGIDQLINTFIGGKPDETISAKAHREAGHGKTGWNIAEKIINCLFLNNKHCYEAYIAELNRSQISSDYQLKWNSVNEKLPTRINWYICRIKGRVCPIISVWHGNRFTNEDVTFWREVE